jgi:hypothetical protein
MKSWPPAFSAESSFQGDVSDPSTVRHPLPVWALARFRSFSQLTARRGRGGVREDEVAVVGGVASRAPDG